MADNQRLSRIEIIPAENGFEVCLNYRPVKPNKNDPGFGEDKKEVYPEVEAALKSIKKHMYEAAKDQRTGSLVDAIEEPEED